MLVFLFPIYPQLNAIPIIPLVGILLNIYSWVLLWCTHLIQEHFSTVRRTSTTAWTTTPGKWRPGWCSPSNPVYPLETGNSNLFRIHFCNEWLCNGGGGAVTEEKEAKWSHEKTWLLLFLKMNSFTPQLPLFLLSVYFSTTTAKSPKPGSSHQNNNKLCH